MRGKYILSFSSYSSLNENSDQYRDILGSKNLGEFVSSDFLSSRTGISKEAIEFVYNEHKNDFGEEPKEEKDIIEYGFSWYEKNGNKFYKEFESFYNSPKYNEWYKEINDWNNNLFRPATQAEQTYPDFDESILTSNYMMQEGAIAPYEGYEVSYVFSKDKVEEYKPEDPDEEVPGSGDPISDIEGIVKDLPEIVFHGGPTGITLDNLRIEGRSEELISGKKDNVVIKRSGSYYTNAHGFFTAFKVRMGNTDNTRNEESAEKWANSHLSRYLGKTTACIYEIKLKDGLKIGYTHERGILTELKIKGAKYLMSKGFDGIMNDYELNIINKDAIESINPIYLSDSRTTDDHRSFFRKRGYDSGTLNLKPTNYKISKNKG
jgi:hypothetical protein